MINPSNFGWIEKLFKNQKENFELNITDEYTLYKKIRQTGLIYGYSVSFEHSNDYDTSLWSLVDFTKVNLLCSLFETFTFQTKSTNHHDFFYRVYDFYKELKHIKNGRFKKKDTEKSITLDLEKILDTRIRTNNNFITKNFSFIVTNGLIFEDVLAFQKFLIHGNIPTDYLKNIEESVVKVVSIILNQKQTKTKYEELIIKLFNNSLRYSDIHVSDNYEISKLYLENVTSDLEKYYLIDICIMAFWNAENEKISSLERDYLFMLSKKLAIDTSKADESLSNFKLFFLEHKSNLPFLNNASVLKNFDLRAKNSVKKTIERSKNSLIERMKNDKELLHLLLASKKRTLSLEEEKKVKKQVQEICKTIPTLMVFLLPGSSILFPMLIKFLPSLVPSLLNENLSDN
ncbi:LETM1-related biofilm-associated protein [Flavobacterium sp.]|uniref:LETM1-related biofilm-associated protein n=1 Tax=Flavobacterium sp. TaxID=239 RepID=UPI002620124C|nr:LETM1-related biofilm-associated protein [Flavobacterium sp.]